ncbi:hypothetical protein [Bacillus kwashiorkori]|uniref:hypothetical protein n=1 Tax=Bacillus kwashiorkori TaxID=1522318 RepID=UPI000784BBD5|nr:hypothetical protein [Bacillus kwashiorkori]
MSKLNNESAPNNNLSAADIKFSKLVQNEEFSEELSDGGERNNMINKQQKLTPELKKKKHQ